jgi:hypothetical protein
MRSGHLAALNLVPNRRELIETANKVVSDTLHFSAGIGENYAMNQHPTSPETAGEGNRPIPRQLPKTNLGLLHKILDKPKDRSGHSKSRLPRSRPIFRVIDCLTYGRNTRAKSWAAENAAR